MNEKRIPLIIDTDPGHDDVIAMLLALSNPKIDVLAITTVQGNQTLDKTTRNALRMKEFIGSDVIVAAGAAHPLASDMVIARGHGETGLDGSTMPDPKSDPAPIHAVELIAQLIEKYPHEVTICVLGSCINIATFILAYPHLVPLVKQLSVMGGGFMRGNRSPAAEQNLIADPLAAAVMFNSGIPITLFALDITLKTGMNNEDVDFFRNQDDPLCAEIARILTFYQGSHRKMGRTMVPVHDACTVAWLIDPGLFTLRPAHVQIDVCGRFTRGESVCDFDGLNGKQPNVMFAVASRREEIVAMIQQAIRRMGERM